jgi:hypothetical protein
VTTLAPPFVEPARRAPVKWLTYELRYALGFAALALGFVILIAVAFPTNPADLSDRAIRNSLLWLPSAGAIASAILLPGRGEHRVLYGAAASVGAGIPFLIMIAMPAPTKLATVVIFALTAGFLVWAWMIVRDRPRLLQLLGPAALVLTLVAAGIATELINGSGTLTVGWKLLTPGPHIADAAAVDLARETLAIWLAQLIVTVVVIVVVAWAGRLLAPRMRYVSPEERNERAAAKLAATPLPAGAPLAVGEAAPATNTMAILALVFAVLGGWLSIVFGILALNQIKRTGEQGRGLAVAALVIAGIWVLGFAAFAAVGISSNLNR